MTALLEYIDILYPVEACNRKYTLSWLYLALCKGKNLCEGTQHNMSVPIHFTHTSSIACSNFTCVYTYLTYDKYKNTWGVKTGGVLITKTLECNSELI